MDANKKKFGSIDEYIGAQPEAVQEILSQIRETIRTAAPEAQETIKYDMPTFTLQGNLIYFAAFKQHIGMFPLTEEIKKKLGRRVLQYQGTKDSIRLPLNQQIPYDLIAKIVKVRVKEDLAYHKKKEAQEKAKAARAKKK